MTANVLPVRLAVTPDTTVSGLLAQTSASLREAFAHQRYRLEDMRRDLKLTDGTPLFGTLVNVMPFDYRLQFGDCPATAHSLASGPVGDLRVSVFDGAADGTMQFGLDVNPDLYGEQAGREMARGFLDVLDWVISAPPETPVRLASLTPSSPAPAASAAAPASAASAAAPASAVAPSARTLPEPGRGPGRGHPGGGSRHGRGHPADLPGAERGGQSAGPAAAVPRRRAGNLRRGADGALRGPGRYHARGAEDRRGLPADGSRLPGRADRAHPARRQPGARGDGSRHGRIRSRAGGGAGPGRGRSGGPGRSGRPGRHGPDQHRTRRAASSGPAGVRDLHLGLDRHAQGCGRRPTPTCVRLLRRPPGAVRVRRRTTCGRCSTRTPSTSRSGRSGAPASRRAAGRRAATR